MGLKIPKEKLECKAKARKRVSSQNESEKWPRYGLVLCKYKQIFTIIYCAHINKYLQLKVPTRTKETSLR
jgi:hypothetical protein